MKGGLRIWSWEGFGVDFLENQQGENKAFCLLNSFITLKGGCEFGAGKVLEWIF